MKMPPEKEIIRLVRNVFEIEIDELKKVSSNVDAEYHKAIQLILECNGKVIISGMGKSGLIGRKIAATLCSTGTLAIYMHPAEALHGDLGVVEERDIIIILGKSGESDEIVAMLPVIKKKGCRIIAITGNVNSTLAKNSHAVLNAYVEKEACPLNLAPTSSSTAALVIGDAVSTVLSQLKEFREEDFAMSHPGGTLGKRLLLKVSDFVHPVKDIAVCEEGTKFREILIKMSDKNLGAAMIVHKGSLKGIISDGDIKRILTKHGDIEELTAKEIMTPNPKTIEYETLAYDALKVMRSSGSFSVMPVLKGSKLAGLIKLHDLLKSGL
ncbi:MAG: KpsF/GutQ family sugar-phosphate isomerase [Candidatus Delongbacteria bacterium]|nr:KpsF/GutQ family sugar-phosphate isomerase [Candidatus Delongbacteria bacterium]MDD4206118.1 KpsF/GutQ family sugar-phosphate isomerase [Candidatus Delongbacteria bacterium]